MVDPSYKEIFVEEEEEEEEEEDWVSRNSQLTSEWLRPKHSQ